MLHVSRRFYSFGRYIVSRNVKKRLNEKKNQKLVDNFFEKNDNDRKIREALKYGNEELKKYKKNDCQPPLGIEPKTSALQVRCSTTEL